MSDPQETNQDEVHWQGIKLDPEQRRLVRFLLILLAFTLGFSVLTMTVVLGHYR